MSWLAADQVEALRGLEALVGAVLVDLEAGGEELPQPLAERPFSANSTSGLGRSCNLVERGRFGPGSMSFDDHTSGKDSGHDSSRGRDENDPVGIPATG